MTRTFLPSAIFACFTLSFSLTALADLAPPPPGKGEKRVPYENVLKLEREIPEYKFYPFKRLGLGGKEKIGEELKLNTKTGVSVPSSSSPSVRTGVVAVPTKVMEELKTAENLAKLLSRDFKGELPKGIVVHETFGTIRDLKTSDPRTKVENVISVLPDEQTGVKFTEKETLPPQSKGATPKTSSTPPLGIFIAVLTLMLSLAILGYWLVRQNPRPSNSVSLDSRETAGAFQVAFSGSQTNLNPRREREINKSTIQHSRTTAVGSLAPKSPSTPRRSRR